MCGCTTFKISHAYRIPIAWNKWNEKRNDDEHKIKWNKNSRRRKNDVTNQKVMMMCFVMRCVCVCVKRKFVIVQRTSQRLVIKYNNSIENYNNNKNIKRSLFFSVSCFFFLMIQLFKYFLQSKDDARINSDWLTKLPDIDF